MIRYLYSNVPFEEKIEFTISMKKSKKTHLPDQSEILVYWLAETIIKEERTIHEKNLLWEALNCTFQRRDGGIGKLSSCSSILSSKFLAFVLKELTSALESDESVLSFNPVLSFLTAVLKASSLAINISFNIDILFQLLGLLLQILLTRFFQCSIAELEPILGLLMIVIEKLVIVCRQQVSSKKVLEKLIPLLRHIIELLCLETDSNMLSDIKEQLKTLSKAVCCHKDLHDTYVDIHKNWAPNQESTDPVEQLLLNLSTMLVNECQSTRHGSGKFLSIILEGVLEIKKASSGNVDFALMDIFCKMMNIENLHTLEEEHFQSSLSSFEEILIVCSTNSTCFMQNPLAENELKFLKCMTEKLLTCSRKPSAAWFGCLTALFSTNAELLQEHIGLIWRHCWLYCGNIKEISVRRKQTTLLCQVLKSYTRLRQLPKLVAKLFVMMKDKTGSKSERFPQEFLHSFSDAVVSLPVGQTLTLWKEFLHAEQLLMNLKSDGSKGGKKWQQASFLFGQFLLHLRVAESCSQDSVLQEVKTLMNETQSFITAAMQLCMNLGFEEHVSQSVLWLCYAWGELHLTLSSFSRAYTPEWCIIKADVDVLDLSFVHKSISAENWTAFLSGSNPEKSNCFVVMLLLVQKIRALFLSGNAFSETGRESVTVVAQYIVKNIVHIQASESDCGWDQQLISVNDETYFAALWSVTLKWLPLLLPFLSSKQLLSICTKMIEFLELKEKKDYGKDFLRRITEKFVSSNYFADSRFLQSSFITALWKHSTTLFAGVKRKEMDAVEESPVEVEVIKCLYKHPPVWVDYGNTNAPHANETERNEMWIQLQKACSLWNTIQSTSSAKTHLKIKSLLHFLKIMNCLPLDNLLPSNQIRCVLGLLCFQSLLRTSCEKKRCDAYTEISKVLVNIFDGVRYVAILNFVDPTSFLKHFFQLVDDILQDDGSGIIEHRWTQLMLEKVFHVTIKKDNFQHFEQFASELNKQRESEFKPCHLLFISTFLKFLTNIQRTRNHQVMPEDQKNSWNEVNRQLVSTIEKRICLYANSRNLNGHIIVFLCDACRAILENISRNSANKVEARLCEIVELSLRVLLECEDESMIIASLNFIRSLSSAKEHLPSLPASIWKRIWNSMLNHLKSQCQVKCKDSFDAQSTDSYRNTIPVGSLNNEEIRTALSVMKHCDKLDSEDIFTELSELAVFIDIDQVNCIELQLVLQLCTSIAEDKDMREQRISDVETLVLRVLSSGNIVLSQAGTNAHHLMHIVVPFLNFFHFLLKKGMSLLRSRNIIQCLQSCAAIPLREISSLPSLFIPLHQSISKVLNEILLEHQVTTVQAIVPIFASLSVLLTSLLKVCERQRFEKFDLEMQQAVPNLIEALLRIITLAVKHKEEFSKSAAFLVSNYLSEIEHIMVHPKLKVLLLPCVYELLNVCNDHSVGMLRSTLSHVGKEIFKILYSDYSNHYKYKGSV